MSELMHSIAVATAFTAIVTIIIAIIDKFAGGKGQ